MKNKENIRLILYCLAILLCLGYILISVNNRYQSDDMGIVWSMRSRGGIWPAFKYNFFAWETNLNTLLLFSIIKWVPFFPAYVFNISIFLINILCFFILLKTIIKNYKIEINIRDTLFISALIMGISYFSCRAMGNAVYWVTAQIVYCLFLSYLFLAIHFWIKQKLALASIFIFLFAHSRINYDAIFIGLYCSYFFFYWYRNKKITFNWKSQIPFFFFLIGLISYVIIPGNYSRLATIPIESSRQQLSLILIIKDWIIAFQYLIFSFINTWKQLVLIPIGILLGIYLNSSSKVKNIVNPSLLFYCSISFIISYIGQSTILSIVLRQPVGYDRVFFFLDILFFSLLLLYSVYLGISLSTSLTHGLIRWFIFFISFGVVSVLCFYFYKQYRMTSLFAKAYDKRIENFKVLKTNPQIKKVYFSHLPNSGILNFMEILPEPKKPNTFLYDNGVYESYYQLPFKIYLKKE
jgi:hypothetical protein